MCWTRNWRSAAIASCATPNDCNIYVRSRRAGERVMTGIEQFLAKRLKLKINKAKSAVAAPRARKFLGFSYTIGASIKRRLAPQTVARFKARVRELTRRTRGKSLAQIIEELSRYLRGWRGYFGFCETPSVLRELDHWTRRRLRAIVWKNGSAVAPGSTALRSRGVGRTWRHKPPAARTARGGSATARLWLSHSPTPPSSRSACLPSCPISRSIRRTAVYGPVCTVVWEGRSREAPPYPDLRRDAVRRRGPSNA